MVYEDNQVQSGKVHISCCTANYSRKSLRSERICRRILSIKLTNMSSRSEIDHDGGGGGGGGGGGVDNGVGDVKDGIQDESS